VIRGTGLAGIHCTAMGSRMRSRLGSKALAKEALARRPLVRKILARETLARKAQTFAQTFVREQVSDSPWRRRVEIVQQRD
jgi:hypothetical protein